MNVRAALARLMLAALLLAGCSGPRSSRVSAPDGDAEYRRLSRLGRDAHEKGSLAQAEILYRKAHQRARALDAPAQIGNAAYNLGAVLIARDEAVEAWPLLDEAEVELSRAGQDPVDVWLVKARLALAEERTADAIDWLDAVDASDEADPASRAQAALLRGELACEAGDAKEASKQLEHARQFTTQSDLFFGAQIERLHGKVALLEQRYGDAAAAFAREAGSYRSAAQPLAMAQALVRAADASAQADDKHAAAERLYRAARSLLAQGRAGMAQQIISRGVELAAECDDKVLQAQLRRLASEAAAAER